MSRPKILITNDDGIFAPGIRALWEAMSEIGDPIVIAPHTEQSAVGHAITLRILYGLFLFSGQEVLKDWLFLVRLQIVQKSP